MGKRPGSITIISWIFIAAGVVGLAYHASEFNAQRPFANDFFRPQASAYFHGATATVPNPESDETHVA